MSTIVFCEDDPSIRKLIETATRRSGHVVHIATDGAEGLALVQRTRPQAVFIDVNMPVMNGLELARRLRASPDFRSIPLVFMTASVQRDELARYGELSALAVLEKPFSVAKLRSRIAETVGGPADGG